MELSLTKEQLEWQLKARSFAQEEIRPMLFFVTARMDPNVSQVHGTTEFLVPLDTPGVRIGKIINKSGWRFYQNAELVFEDARVPHANMVGEINGGFHLRSGTSQPFGDFELFICTCSPPTGRFFPAVTLSHCRGCRELFLPRAFGAPCSIFW